MADRLPLTDKEGEVRELTEEDFLRTKLSALKVRKQRKTVAKAKMTVRLSQEVIDVFRAMGNRWETHIDDILKEWIKTHSLP